MKSRCLTLSAVALLAALAASTPVAQATHTNLLVQPFAMTLVALDANVAPGESSTWNVTLSNPNLFPRDITLGMPTDTQLPVGWTYSLAQTVSVPAQSNASAILTIFVPADERTKTVGFVVEGADADAHVQRLSGNVSVTAAPAPPDPAELPPPVVSPTVSTGDSGPSGSIVQGELVIRNTDTLRTVRLQIRPIPRDGWAAYVQDADANRVIGPGAVAIVPLFVQVPALTEDTTTTFDISIVDPEQGVRQTARWSVLGLAPADEPETSTTGETTPSPTTGTTTGSDTTSGVRPMVPGPNLDVFIEPVEVEVTSGAKTTATVRLVNTGSTLLTVRLLGDEPQSWPEGAFGFDPAQGISLASGEVARVPLTIEAPAGIPIGGRSTAAVTAVADGGLTRRATFQLRIVDSVPTDASSAALVEAPVSPSASEGLDGPVALVVVGLAAVGAGAAVLASRPLREKLLWGAAGLYTRLARPDVLGHEDREKLYRLVETTPGIHFHALQRDLAWNTGTLTYHLRVLEKHGFMVSRRDGLYRRFYLSGAAPRKEVFENQGPTGLRADVLEAVRTQPGISQSDLALGLSANKQTVNYHVKALERAGTIRVEKRGRDTYLYPAEPGAAPAAVPPPPGGIGERERARL